jgi:hypothetical protein
MFDLITACGAHYTECTSCINNDRIGCKASQLTFVAQNSQVAFSSHHTQSKSCTIMPWTRSMWPRRTRSTKRLREISRLGPIGSVSVSMTMARMHFRLFSARRSLAWVCMISIYMVFFPFSPPTHDFRFMLMLRLYISALYIWYMWIQFSSHFVSAIFLRLIKY